MKAKTKKENVGLFLLGICLMIMLPPAMNQLSEKDGREEELKFSPHPEGNAIYYWKTRFELTDEDREFLEKHEIKRLYVRFFDVAYEYDNEEKVVPIATTVFDLKGQQPANIIPTVYITLDALKAMKGKEEEFADKIVDRIQAMIKGNFVPDVNEVQLDCDWTKSTQPIFFELCEATRKRLHAKKMALSSTIRLHQLHSEEPPVDRGVLMLYNTGAIKRMETENSILSVNDIAPYLKEVDYKLHLDYAYPTFAWGIWFRDKEFKAILRTTSYTDSTSYSLQADGTYRVVKDHYLENHSLKSGDIIRLEKSEYNEIMRVKELVSKTLPKSQSSILYHLDMNNLTKYNDDEIKNIYSNR